MPTIYTHIDSNIRKTWLLIGVFLILVIGLGWLFSYLLDDYIILIIAVLFAFFMNFLSYWYSDKIVLALSGAQLVSRESARELYNVVENLCITAGLPTPKIYVINSQAPNAFATGRDSRHSVVTVTTGLLNKLNKQELEGVIAHELSHIGNRDMLLMTVAVILAGFVALLADFFLRFTFWGGGRRRSRNQGQAGALLAILGLVAAILAPLAAALIKLAISRKREFLADADAVLLTRYPEGLARALEKISADTASLRQAKTATAHLFIVNPLKGSALLNLFSTHPPIKERIKRLRAI